MATSKQIQAARYRLVRNRPYISSLVFRVVFIESNKVPLAGVDKYWRLYYNPQTIGDLSVKELETILYHEMMHLLRDHHGRFDFQKDRELANLATDMEINDDINAEGLPWPSTIPMPDGKRAPFKPITPDDFNLPYGKTAEWYLEQLRKHAVKVEISMPHGTGAGGEQQPWELDKPAGSGKDGEDGVSKDEQQLVRTSVARQIQEACKHRGDIPAGLRRFAEEFLKPPQVPWQTVLRASIRQQIAIKSGLVDYTYSRPARRSHSYLPVVMPSLYAPTMRIAVIVDTSGSMSEQELGAALAEIRGVLRAHQGETIYLSVDADVHVKKRIRSLRDVEFVGGGGTDMAKGFEVAEKENVDLIICITDGYTPWPQTKPKPTSIVVIVGSERNSSYYDDIGVPEWVSRTVFVKS